MDSSSKTLFMTVIGLAVAVLVLMTVMVPVISSELQHTETVTETVDNYGTYTMVDHFEIVRVDGGTPMLTSSPLYESPVNYGSSSSNNFIVLENAILIRYSNVWTILHVADGEAKKTSMTSTSTLTFSDGVLTLGNLSIPCSYAFLIDDNGKWAYATFAKEVIWNADKVYNFNFLAADFGVLEWTGNQYHTNFWGSDTTDRTETYAPNTDLIGHIPMGNDEGWVLLGGMFRWMIPLEYTYTETVESEGTIFTLIQIIPLLAILGLILIPVGLFVRRSAR